MITSNFIHWTAGFVDGEGNFMQTGGWKSGSGVLVISVAQKAPELLERLQNAYGGRIYGGTSSGKKVLQWKLTGHQAIGLAMMLYPLLSQKRRGEIRRMMDLWRQVKGAKKWGVYDTCIHGHERTPENTWAWKRNGYRRCRLCAKVTRSAYRKRRRERLRLAAGI
jgi:hypothetical protein